MSEPTRCHDVAIVGFGPVGAVLAALLGQAGLDVAVVDRARDIYDKPRALALDHEIARILQGLGLGEAIVPHVAPFTASEFFGADGRLIKRLTMLPPPHPQAWTPSMVFMQPAVEALVRQRCAELPTVDVRLGATLLELAQAEDRVTLRLCDESDGRAFACDARYVIGCDGASSTVRRQVALDLDDLGFDQAWLVVDLIANARGLQRLPATSAQFCEPARPSSFLVGTGAHRRFEIMLLPGEDPRRMEQPEEVWRLLARWLTPEEATLWRAASYRFHALVARRWREGRLLIAGDAAHQQPPFLGQGLCQGIRDAANLAWKLVRVLGGRSSPALLDTYQLERAEHVRLLTETIKGIGGLISERDAARAKERDERLIAAAGGTIQSQPRQDLMPALHDGCLGRPCAGRGTLFPQPMILTAKGPQRLDDVVGGGWRLVLGSAAAPIATDVAARLDRLSCRVARIGSAHAAGSALVEADGVVADWLTNHAATAAIVRPDHYVFATAATADELAAAVTDLEQALA